MKKVLLLLAAALAIFIIQSCNKSTPAVSLQKELIEYLKDKDADIGIAVIVNRTDTIVVNGNKSFPMLSVYKFPIAVAVGEFLRVNNETIPDSVTITQSDLKPDTYSPMRDRYAGHKVVQLPLYDIIAYALQQSDNNASDMLLKVMGGTDKTLLALKRLGFEDINITSTEAEMYENNQLCYNNTSTPIAMAQMLDRFDHDFDDPYARKIKRLMETCKTGRNRLTKPLSGTNAIIGHKTGTGFRLPDGRLMAINDVGYVHLPDGQSYSIAVFIENSGYDIPQTENIIAEISEIVFNYVNGKYL